MSSFEKYFLLELNKYSRVKNIHTARKYKSSTGFSRDRLNLLPDYHRTKVEPKKLAILKNRKQGKFVLSDTEFRQLQDIFTIDEIPDGKTKKLGNTGINITNQDNIKYIWK